MNFDQWEPLDRIRIPSIRLIWRPLRVVNLCRCPVCGDRFAFDFPAGYKPTITCRKGCMDENDRQVRVSRRIAWPWERRVGWCRECGRDCSGHGDKARTMPIPFAIWRADRKGEGDGLGR